MAIPLLVAIESAVGVSDVKPAAPPVVVPPSDVVVNPPSTAVTISELGQLFAAAGTFQTQLAAIQPGAANTGTGQNFGTDLSSFAAEAQNFVDAFNQVKGAIAGLNVAQASQFEQSLDNLALATFANGTSGVDTLAQIGIILRGSADGISALGIDMRSLQLAFNANPAASFSLLTEAVQSFGTLAAGVQTGQDTTGASATLAQIVALQTSLGIFTGDGNSAPLGLAALLALEPNSPNANNLGQQIAALSQFALVSSLIS